MNKINILNLFCRTRRIKLIFGSNPVVFNWNTRNYHKNFKNQSISCLLKVLKLTRRRQTQHMLFGSIVLLYLEYIMMRASFSTFFSISCLNDLSALLLLLYCVPFKSKHVEWIFMPTINWNLIPENFDLTFFHDWSKDSLVLIKWKYENILKSKRNEGALICPFE